MFLTLAKTPVSIAHIFYIIPAPLPVFSFLLHFIRFLDTFFSSRRLQLDVFCYLPNVDSRRFGPACWGKELMLWFVCGVLAR